MDLGLPYFLFYFIFVCGELNPFIITFHGVHCAILGLGVITFLDLNTPLVNLLIESYL